MGYTFDLMPHIGEVPGAPSQYIMAGFSGHGMPQILLASRGLAAMVTDGVSYEQTGLPVIFKTTQERLSSPYSELEEGFKDIWASASQREVRVGRWWRIVAGCKPGCKVYGKSGNKVRAGIFQVR